MPSGSPNFVVQVVDVIDKWLAGRMTDAEAAEWAFQNTDFAQRYSAPPQEAERLWQALGALAMLSSCQPEDARSTRQEIERARGALHAGLGRQ